MRTARVGDEVSPCYIIAEIGLNHNGNLGLAVESIEAAAACGVDAVKFQNFRTEDFLVDRTLLHTYRRQGHSVTESLYDICKRVEFRREWFGTLVPLCREKGVDFLSTPTSEEGVNDLVAVGCPLLKNGSDYLSHIPLIRYMARTGLPLLLSTGMADLEDVQGAVEAFTSAGNDHLILLHCVSNYPTRGADVNLRRMVALREKFGLPVGFSDHTEGWVAAVQAVTLGAVVVEKHFTLSRDLDGPDHWFSSDPRELAALVREVREARERMGSGRIAPAKSELDVRDAYRLGLVAARDLPAGHVLQAQDMAFRKPCTGLSPREMDEAVSRRIIRPLRAGESVQRDNLAKRES